jgi:hypothetical protein
LLFFVLCALCCEFLWIVHFWLPLRYSLTFIHIVHTIVHFSVDCMWLVRRISLTMKWTEVFMVRSSCFTICTNHVTFM